MFGRAHPSENNGDFGRARSRKGRLRARPHGDRFLGARGRLGTDRGGPHKTGDYGQGANTFSLEVERSRAEKGAGEQSGRWASCPHAGKPRARMRKRRGKTGLRDPNKGARIENGPHRTAGCRRNILEATAGAGITIREGPGRVVGDDSRQGERSPAGRPRPTKLSRGRLKKPGGRPAAGTRIAAKLKGGAAGEKGGAP